MEYLTDADYAHAKGVRKDFARKNLEEYHDLYVQSNTLLSGEIYVLKYMNFICSFPFSS